MVCALLKKNFALKGFTLINFPQAPPHLYLFVHRMRNHPSVATVSFRSYIPLKEHLLFKERLRNNDTTAYWVVKKENTIWGVISLQLSGKKAKAGLYKNPFLPQRGVGKKLLKLIGDIARICGVQELELEVKRDNRKALNLYRREGFKVREDTPRVLKLFKRVKG